MLSQAVNYYCIKPVTSPEGLYLMHFYISDNSNYRDKTARTCHI